MGTRYENGIRKNCTGTGYGIRERDMGYGNGIVLPDRNAGPGYQTGMQEFRIPHTEPGIID